MILFCVYSDIVKFLIKNGANVNDTGGKHCDNITPINDAAINGHFEVVQLLLDTGANPNIASIRVFMCSYLMYIFVSKMKRR